MSKIGAIWKMASAQPNNFVGADQKWPRFTLQHVCCAVEIGRMSADMSFSNETDADEKRRPQSDGPHDQFIHMSVGPVCCSSSEDAP